jgi:hypothetical protein
MGKDRRRAVKAYHARSSHARPVLTTARVGIYGYIHTIYIRRYGTRDTTLTPWISKSHLFTESQGHRLTRATNHQPPGSQVLKPPSHRLTRPLDHLSHQPPMCSGAWLTEPPAPWSVTLPPHHFQTSKTPAYPPVSIL